MMKFKLEGSREFQRAMDELGEDARERVDTRVKQIAQKLRQDIVSDYKKSGSGTTYYRIPGPKYMTIRKNSESGPPVAFIPGGGAKNLSRQHTASRKNQAPAMDTGKLSDSVALKGYGRAGFEIYVVPLETRDGGSKKKKITYREVASILEHGNHKIEKRPNWVPKVEAAREVFDDMVEKVLAAAIKKRRAGR